MIDKEYIKEIISRITKKKADGNIVPATASMQEIMIAVRDDALECMRTMCNEREIAVNRTLNSVSFKCLGEDITIRTKCRRSSQTRSIGLERFIHGRRRSHTRLRMMLGSF